ncbi:MAG: class II aldolase/adducin family protein [Roseiflexaceae bacterium]
MQQEPLPSLAEPALDLDERLTFTTAGETSSAFVAWYTGRLRDVMTRQGHTHRVLNGSLIMDAVPEGAPSDPRDQVRLVFNMCDIDRPRPLRRSGQGTFVVTIVEGTDDDPEVMKAAYPVLVRSLSNMVIYNLRIGGVLESHFITIEQGHYTVRHTGSEEQFFDHVFARIQPLACSHLVINNEFIPDLPDDLWAGDETTRQISWISKQLDGLGLVPAVFPIHLYLSEREMRHLKRLYGIGGLSYGNLSARAPHNPHYFWMSASGVDKSRLEQIGRDILLVTGYDPDRLMIRLSVPPTVEPRRVSVDAIEHYMIYRAHPEVGAIVHIHAWWRDPILSTQVNYPCGTYELATEVADLVRQTPDPSRAVIGLKNHGLTITGRSIPEIFARIDGKIVPQVPMA